MRGIDFSSDSLPSLAPLEQRFPTEHVSDVRRETRDKLLGAGLRDKVKTGNRIAITAGSRGMGGFIELLSGIIDAVKSAGGKPFIIPAMGSHGSATGDGQKEILRR